MKAREWFQQWDSVRTGLYEALKGLTDQQLCFTPRDGLWSLGRTALHIADAEDGWFNFIIRGELDEWPADSNFKNYLTVTKVVQRLRKVHAHTETYLKTLDVPDLERVIAAPWGEKFTLGWAVWHVLEHEIHHRGEIYLMLGLMGKEAPDV